MTAKAVPTDRATLEGLIRTHGSVDLAARECGFARDHFRVACRRAGITKAHTLSSFQVEGVSREALLELELKEARAELAKARTGRVLDERIIQTLDERISAKHPRFTAPTRSKSKTSPHSFVLLWSDVHAAERVEAEQIHGINSYDWTVMLNRHALLVEKVLSFKDNRPYPVEALHIAGLGDQVTGDIHDELRETNEMVIMEAALQLGLDCAEWVEELIPHFPRITIDGVVGNHGRVPAKPSSKNPHNNFDWMVYHIMRLRLASYPSVEVRVPKSSSTVLRVYDRNLFLWHGDGVRSSMPGVPHGGIARRVNELDKQFGPVFGRLDHFCSGHWHEMFVEQGVRIIGNGSVKGPDEFSIKHFGKGAPARQLLLPFHPRHGLTEICLLDLQEVM